MWPRLLNCVRAIKPLRGGFIADWGTLSLSRRVMARKVSRSSPSVRRLGVEVGPGCQPLMEQKIKMLEAQIDQQARAVIELQANVMILLQKEQQNLQGANCMSSGKPSALQYMVGSGGNVNAPLPRLEDVNLSGQLDRIESRISHLQKQKSSRQGPKLVRKPRPSKIQRASDNKRKRGLAAMDAAMDRLSDVLKGVEKSLQKEQLGGKDGLTGNTLARIEAMEALLRLQETRISQLSSSFGVVNVNNYPSAAMNIWPTHVDSRYATPMYASASFWSFPTVLAEALGVPDGAWDMDLDEDDVLLNYLITIGVPGALLHASREVVDDQAWFHARFLKTLISWLEYEFCRLLPSFASKPQPPKQYWDENQRQASDSIDTDIIICQNINESGMVGKGGVQGSGCCEKASASEINAVKKNGHCKNPNDKKPFAKERSCLELHSGGTVSTDNGPNPQQISRSSGSPVLEREPIEQSASQPQIVSSSGGDPSVYVLHTLITPDNSGNVCETSKNQMDGSSTSRTNIADEIPPTQQVDLISSQDAHDLKSGQEHSGNDSSSSLSYRNKGFRSRSIDSFGSSNERVPSGRKSEQLPNTSDAMDRIKDSTIISQAARSINKGTCEQSGNTQSCPISEERIATRRRAKSCGNWPFPTVGRRSTNFARRTSDEIYSQFEMAESSKDVFEPIKRQNSFGSHKKKKKSRQYSFEAERILGGQRVGSFCDHPEAVYIDNPLFGKKWASSNSEIGLDERASARTNPLFEDDIQNTGELPVAPVSGGSNWIVSKTDPKTEEWAFQSGLQASQSVGALRL